jgi:hypothetical protein
MITCDQALTLEGLELRREGLGMSDVARGPAFLLVSERAPLRLRNCSLLVPHGSGAIVCRDPQNVELQDCELAAYALALFIEAGEQSPCTLVLNSNSINIADPKGAALCICGSSDSRPSGAVKLRLDGNVVRAGRLAGFQRLSQTIDIEAYGNQFTFHEALISYRELPEHNGWRQATVWRGRENRYSGATDWIQSDGAPAGVHGLQDWQTLWRCPEPGSADTTPAAYRAKANRVEMVRAPQSGHAQLVDPD